MYSGGGAIPGNFEWSPDGTRLAYLARQNSYVTELFTTLADGSSNVRIPSLSAGSRGVDQFSWAPDGSRLAYRGTTTFPPADTVELYTALPDGTGELNLSQSGALALGSHLWSPDSTILAFELYGQLRTVSATGGAISDPAPGRLTSQYYYKWAPNSSRLAFVVVTSPHELFTCLPNGTGVNPISGPFAAGAGIGLSFGWSSDSSRLVYLTDQETVGIQELFSAPAAGGPIKLSGALPPGSSVGWFSVN
jgi:Tol biopolymer transport system component